MSDTLYFWRETTEAGWLSQWYASPFYDDADASIIYKTAEHYMMYQKAILFENPTMAAKILKGGHPREVKNMGRKIKNFDEDTWVQHREMIVTKGTLLKFTKPVRDEGLKDKLLATEDKEIVEASPYDRIWGIGFTEQHAEDLRDDWGLNLLGKAIMTVRTQLRQEGEVKA